MRSGDIGWFAKCVGFGRLSGPRRSRAGAAGRRAAASSGTSCYAQLRMDVPDLRTARLLLRRLTRDDARYLQPLFSDWEVIRHMAKEIPWPYPEDGVLGFVDNVCEPAMAKGERMFWVIVPDDVGQPVGLLEYRIGTEERDNRGFWLGKPYQGRGYMTEAVQAFQDYIFFERGVEQIVVQNSVENLRSRRVKEKTGAVRAGDLSVEHHNGSSACERWVVTRSAWAKIRGRSDMRK